jgi:hypothetical protein
MRNLTDIINSHLPFLGAMLKTPEPQDRSFDVFENKNLILKEMEYSAKTRNVVGVYSRVLGNGMFLVGVEEVIEGAGDKMIVFYPYDMGGYELPRRILFLDEISSIVPFNNGYVSPYGDARSRQASSGSVLKDVRMPAAG